MLKSPLKQVKVWRLVLNARSLLAAMRFYTLQRPKPAGQRSWEGYKPDRLLDPRNLRLNFPGGDRDKKQLERDRHAPIRRVGRRGPAEKAPQAS